MPMECKDFVILYLLLHGSGSWDPAKLGVCSVKIGRDKKFCQNIMGGVTEMTSSSFSEALKHMLKVVCA